MRNAMRFSDTIVHEYGNLQPKVKVFAASEDVFGQ
jgi:hypothetical protein